MKNWIRRVRGALGMGLAWAAAWFAAGMVLLLIVGPGAADVPFPLGFGLLGFLAGTTFGGVLGLTEGRRRFDQMSLPRFATWGGIAGILFAVVFVFVAGMPAANALFLGPLFGLAGAGCATGVLALARSAESESLGASAAVDEAGLTEDEVRELLGPG